MLRAGDLLLATLRNPRADGSKGSVSAGTLRKRPPNKVPLIVRKATPVMLAGHRVRVRVPPPRLFYPALLDPLARKMDRAIAFRLIVRRVDRLVARRLQLAAPGMPLLLRLRDRVGRGGMAPLRAGAYQPRPRPGKALVLVRYPRINGRVLTM